MNEALRILLVADVSPLTIRGGAERLLWEEASRLARRGHRVRLACRAPEGETPAEVERDGVHIRHFPCDRRSGLRHLLSSIRNAGQAVTELLGKEPADVLLAFQPLGGFGAFRVRAARAVPACYTFLSPAPLEYASRAGMTARHRGGLAGQVARLVLRAVEGRCLRRAVRIRVLSDFSRDQLGALYRISGPRIVRIPGGVDLARFHPAADPSAVRRDLGLPSGEPLLLTVRNLEYRMGLDNLLRAMALLRPALPHFRLLIGGTGSQRTELEALSARLELQAHVSFLGYLSDESLPRYYQAADMFVLPTRELEGFGLISVEALACGTPVLGTPVGAIPEVLRPLDPALLFPETTPQAMAEHLSSFWRDRLTSPAAAMTLRHACRRHAETSFDWARCVERLEDMLRGVAAAPGSPQ
jgi:glycosyltransferase involved in cell wall biosynthesis